MNKCWFVNDMQRLSDNAYDYNEFKEEGYQIMPWNFYPAFVCIFLSISINNMNFIATKCMQCFQHARNPIQVVKFWFDMLISFYTHSLYLSSIFSFQKSPQPIEKPFQSMYVFCMHLILNFVLMFDNLKNKKAYILRNAFSISCGHS